MASLLAFTAWAEPEIKVSIEAETFYEGQGFEMVVTALAEQPPAEVELAYTDVFYAQTLKEGIAEQGDQRLYLYRYRLIPRRDGALRIPPVEMMINGEFHSTTSEVIRVQAAQTTDELRLETFIERTTCFAGEALLFTCIWYSALPLGEIKAMDISAPVLSDPSWRVLIPQSERALKGDGTIGLPVEGQRIICRVSDVDLNGKPFKAVTFKRILVPLREGRLMIPPVRMLCSHMQGGRRQGTAYPSYFDNNFFHAVEGGGNYVRYGLRSNALELQVNPLPEAGRPPEFSGLVGTMDLNVALEPKHLTLGEPTQITLTLKGHAHPESINLPSLKSMAALDDLFVLPDDIGRGKVEKGERSYRFAAVPRRSAITEFPSLQLNYFDTASSTYKELSGGAIALSVAPDGDRTELEIQSEDSETRLKNESGLWHNLRTSDAGWKTVGAWILVWTAPLWLLLPPLAYFFSIRPAQLALLRKKDPKAATRMTAFAVLKKTLKQSLPQPEKRIAVSTYFSAFFDSRPGSLSFADIERALKLRKVKLSEALSKELKTLYHHADVVRFDQAEAQEREACSVEVILSELKSVEKGLQS